MTNDELVNDLEIIHEELRDKSSDVLVMINLANINIELKTRSVVFGDTTTDFNTTEAIEDCGIIREMFNLNQTVLDAEKIFLDKVFFEYEEIQKIWLLHKYIDEHILIYSAILFRSVKHFIYFNNWCISEFLESYPFSYEYSLKSGKEILELKVLYRSDREKYDDECRKYSGVFCIDKYKIKKTKWYVLREYHRHLLGRYNRDLGFMENVDEYGFTTKKEAIEVLNNIGEFEPRHKIGSCHMCSKHIIKYL